MGVACVHPRALAVYSSGRIVLFDTVAGAVVRDTPITTHCFTCVAIGSTPAHFLAGTAGGRLVSIDGSSGLITSDWEAHGGYRVEALASHDGVVVSCGRDGAIVRWNGQVEEVMHRSTSFWHRDSKAMATSGDGRAFHVAMPRHELKCVHAARGGEELEPCLRIPSQVGDVRHMSADAHRVVIIGRGSPGHVYVADFTTREVHAVRVIPSGPATVAAIRGDWVVVGTGHGHVMYGGEERKVCRAAITAMHVEWGYGYLIAGDKYGELRMFAMRAAPTPPLSCGVALFTPQEAAMAHLLLMDEARARADRKAVKREEMSYALSAHRVDEDLAATLD